MDLCCWKRPLCQLRHNHGSWLYVFLFSKDCRGQGKNLWCSGFRLIYFSIRCFRSLGYWILDFFKYGPTLASFLFIFTVKLFSTITSQTGLSMETFPHLWQVVFAFQAFLSKREGILGRCQWYLLALQDREVTIIMQTIADTMSLGWSASTLTILLFGIIVSPKHRL